MEEEYVVADHDLCGNQDYEQYKETYDSPVHSLFMYEVFKFHQERRKFAESRVPALNCRL